MYKLSFYYILFIPGTLIIVICGCCYREINGNVQKSLTKVFYCSTHPYIVTKAESTSIKRFNQQKGSFLGSTRLYRKLPSDLI